MGLRIGNGVQWTGKIFLNPDSAVTGFLGLTNRGNGETRAGASMQYQRIHRLLDLDKYFWFYGAGVIGEIGDQSGFGVGPQFGLSTDIKRRVNIELDIFPTYYFSDELDFVLNFGVSIRYISKS